MLNVRIWTNQKKHKLSAMEHFVSSSLDNSWNFCLTLTLQTCLFLVHGLTSLRSALTWWAPSRKCDFQLACSMSSHHCGVSVTSERSVVWFQCLMCVCEHPFKHTAIINPVWAGLQGSSTMECEEFYLFHFVNQMLFRIKAASWTIMLQSHGRGWVIAVKMSVLLLWDKCVFVGLTGSRMTAAFFLLVCMWCCFHCFLTAEQPWMHASLFHP